MVQKKQITINTLFSRNMRIAAVLLSVLLLLLFVVHQAALGEAHSRIVQSFITTKRTRTPISKNEKCKSCLASAALYVVCVR
uniref:Putative secreted protein n=1 Tax=Rhipicephalus microplus TaxID=6941 RepID=A0A6M2DAV4_RHIMP